MHDEVIASLAIGLTAAFVGGLLAQRLGLPTLVGYLLAGVPSDLSRPAWLPTQGWRRKLAEVLFFHTSFGKPV